MQESLKISTKKNLQIPLGSKDLWENVLWSSKYSFELEKAMNLLKRFTYAYNLHFYFYSIEMVVTNLYLYIYFNKTPIFMKDYKDNQEKESAF